MTRLRSRIGRTVRARSFVVLGAIIIAAGACGGCASSAPAARRTGPPSTPASASSPARADYTGTGTAHGCSTAPGAIVVLTADPDGFTPNLGCVQVIPGQRLRVVNDTNGYGQVGETITVTMRGLPTVRIRRGGSATYPEPIAIYLAAGQHYGTCSCEPGGAFDVWVLTSAPTTRAPGSYASASASGMRRCAAGDLRAALIRHGGEASQTFSVLVLTNRSTTPCSVNGYPAVTAAGHTNNGRTHVLAVAIRHGTYFRPDPGPHPVVLARGRSASCVVETETASSGGANPDTITELGISPPGTTTRETVHADLGATGPPGRPVPIFITALVAGAGGPPQRR